jgi:quinol monooxygenase YgiN
MRIALVSGMTALAAPQGITCSIIMEFPPDKRAGALHLLQSVTGITESKTGCAHCGVFQETVGEDPEFLYTETWDSEAHFEKHVCSEEFNRVLEAFDLSVNEPQVTVGNLIGQGGLEYLRQLHGQHL